MTPTKRFRLWISASGAPLYVECLDIEPSMETVELVKAAIQGTKESGETLILGPEWELRMVLA